MRAIDWFLFGGPSVALLGLAVWTQTMDLPTGAHVAAWACWAGFTFILVHLAWFKTG